MEPLVHEQAYRGKEVVEKLKKLHVIVCGCGAIGSNLIYNMIRQGFETITVIDMDRIENHNRGSQIWGVRETNGKKAQVMKNIAYASMGITITAFDTKVDKGNVGKFLLPGSLVIDSFDNFESRGVILEYCKAKSIDCLHIGLSGGYAEIVWNEKYKIEQGPTGADVCEYPLSRNISMLAVTIGIETMIRFAGKDEKISRSITLGDLKVTVLE